MNHTGGYLIDDQGMGGGLINRNGGHLYGDRGMEGGVTKNRKGEHLYGDSVLGGGLTENRKVVELSSSDRGSRNRAALGECSSEIANDADALAERSATQLLLELADGTAESQGEWEWINSRTPMGELEVSTPSSVSTLDAVYQLTCSLFPSLATDSSLKEEMSDFTSEACKRCDKDYGESEAIKWAQGFQINPEILVRDSADLLRHENNFCSLVTERLANLSPNRLSRDRILRNISLDNPERERLLLLADGVPILTADGFVPNGLPADEPLPRLSAGYVKVACAVNKLLSDSILSKGLGILLPKELARAAIPDLHVSYLGWTPKWGKESGRNLNDGSRTSNKRDWLPLNGEEVKLACDEKWGRIQHCTIIDYVRLILRFYDEQRALDPNFTWAQVRLWKLDLKGAYTLISFSPEDVKWMAAELDEDRLIFFLCGVFGWTGMPAAFQVVTRAVSFELLLRLKGLSLMYVDDIAGVTRVDWLEFDMNAAKCFCEEVLGVGCVEPSKSIAGQRIDFLGYTVDIHVLLVGIARKNVLKALHAYFQASTSTGATLLVREFQALASYAVRYRTICSLMAPFVRALYVNIRGRNQNARVKVSPESARTILLMRALLILTAVREQDFAAPLFGYADAPISWRIEFDASLKGLGIIFFLITAAGEVPMGAVVADITQLQFGNSAKNQNTAEFLCVVVAFLVMAKRGIAPCQVGLRGDSRSALHWASTQSFKSELVCNASVAMVLLAKRFGYVVTDEQHLAGVKNVRCDDLSRGVRGVADLRKDEGWGALEDWSIDSKETEVLFDLLRPDYDSCSEERFVGFFGSMQSEIDKIVGSGAVVEVV
jgi:hypothetical protein